MRSLIKYLSLPETRDLNLDRPEASELRKKIIAKKGLLQRIYAEWFFYIFDTMQKKVGKTGICLELGGGGADFRGYCQTRLPNWQILKTDILPLSGLNIVLDATKLPLKTESVDAISMINVFHHIPDISSFLLESQRALKPGGILCMVEPWNTPWSRFINQHLHTEPFNPDATEWRLRPGSPLTGANGALPWIVFERDRKITRALVPELTISEISLHMPIIYLASGGVSMRSFAPGWMFKPLRMIEKVIPKDVMAMYAYIVIEKCFTK